MQIFYESLDQVLERAKTALVVDVQSVSKPKDEGYWRIVDFTATLVEIIFGQLKHKKSFTCNYSQGRPHFRGQMSVSPLVSGSGLEFQVKKGDRVIFLLLNGNTDSAPPLELLRIEDMGNINLIRKTKIREIRLDKSLRS